MDTVSETDTPEPTAVPEESAPARTSETATAPPTSDATETVEPTPGDVDAAGGRGWLVGAAVLIGLLGVALVVGGFYLFGSHREEGTPPSSES